MKRVLLDHCVPRRVRLALANCEVSTAYERGWNELRNGDLLRAAETAGFEVFISADKSIRHQLEHQSQSGRGLSHSKTLRAFGHP